jgi:aspartate aminotransferase-like enzyme
LFGEKGYESETLTCIKNTRGISIDKLNKELGKEYMQISNGYGDLKEKTFRIAHMGDTQMYEIEGLLVAIERIMAAKGDALLPDPPKQ